MRLFLPSPRETNALIFLGFAALGTALYLDNRLLDSAAFAAACDAGAARAATCALLRVIVESQQLHLFGGVALVATIAHLVQPRVVLFAAALVAAMFGLVLANTGLSALAAALLIISFARPVRASKPLPAPARQPPAKPPANSTPSH